jgi:type II secretory pathway component GspD/PulD (secretin)
MKFITAFLFILILSSHPALAGDIEIIQLENRLAQEIMPMIKPMLAPGDAISGQGYQLFIRTSEENLQQIRKLISRLDREPKMLLISVFQGSDDDFSELTIDGAINYRNGRNRLHLGQSGTEGRGAEYSYRTPSGSATARIINTTRRGSQRPVHRLRIIEGTPGYIETGQSIPFFSGTAWQNRRDRVERVLGGVEYKEIHTGFYVLPHLRGNQVTLDVSPYRQTPNKKQGGAYETSGAETRIIGPLGQWLLIGGITQQSRNEQSGIGKTHSTRSSRAQKIWIKAELVP